MNKVIAVDIDDTLNNFSEVLSNLQINYNERNNLDRDTFDRWLKRIKDRSDEGLEKNRGFLNFTDDIHRQCYSMAKARPDAIKFMQWLKQNNWRIIILTNRDLRYCIDDTKIWLADNNIPYDYIFSAGDKVLFCKLFNINYLIDDANYNVVYAPGFDINTFFLINDRNFDCETAACGFMSFDELYSKFEVLK